MIKESRGKELKGEVRGKWNNAFAMLQVMVNEVLAAAPNRRVSITLAKSGLTPEELKRDFMPWKEELEQDGVEVHAGFSESIEKHQIIFERKY